MFNELTKMLSGEKKNRRHSPRKKVRFKLTWISNTGEAVPAMGMEISLSGCLIATKQPPATPTFDAVMEIGQRRLRVRLKIARSGTIAREGQTWTLIGCSFQGIAADDYDALARYFKDIPESENRLVKELAGVDKTDDAYRLLPMRVQQRMLEALVRLGRLEMPAQNQQPLLRVSELGAQDGKKRLAVHSRIPAANGQDPQSFDTVLAVDDAGIVYVEQ